MPAATGRKALGMVRLSRPAVAAVASGEDLPQPGEFFVALEVDRDPPAALGGLAEIDFRAQGGAKFLLQRAICSLRGAATGAIALGVDDPQLVAIERRMRSCTPCSVARTDRPSFWIRRANSICSCSSPNGNSARAWPCEMSPCLHHLLHLGRQLQQPDQIGDGRAVDLHPRGQLFLRALVLVDVALERLGLFDRVEVLALNVLDDGQLGHLPVVDVADLHGHLPPVGGLGGAQPALAGDQLVAVAGTRRTTSGCKMPCVRMLSARSAISASSNVWRG